jgi:GDP-4-dehydro-6-deoxy-D-mannose reductase
MRALVTGSGGFVGGHLLSALRSAGFEVLGIERPSDTPTSDAVTMTRVTGDVRDGAFVTRTLQEFRPSHIFHLAWEFAGGGAGPTVVDANVEAAATFFEAVNRATVRPWVMLASSSAVYGSPAVQPIDEETPLQPITPYAASKVVVEQTASRLAREHGGALVVARTFNLVGPGVPQRLFPGSLAAQIVAAERGAEPIIRVGRLDSARDYLDVRDAARAYVALATRPPGEPAVFNVCAGVARSCLELAQEFISAARVPVRLEQDTTRLQVGDVDTQRGTAARLERATGWRPTISLSSSVRAMLELRRCSAARDMPHVGVTPLRFPSGNGASTR